MTQGQYYVGLDLDRNRYFPRGVADGDALNLVDNPQQLLVTRVGATANPPTYTRQLYDPDYTYYWQFITGTGVNAAMYIGNTDAYEQAVWVTAGQEITVRMDFLGVANYTGEQLVFNVLARGGVAVAGTAVNLTGSWQSATLTFTPDTDHLLIAVTRVTTTTNVTYWLRKLLVVYGASAPTAYNTGSASDYYADISTYVQQMSWSNGMDHYDQTVSGGARASIVVDNKDGWFYQEDDLATDDLDGTGAFTSWTGGVPSGTLVVPTAGSDPNNEITETSIDQLHGGSGTAACNIYAEDREWVYVSFYDQLVVGQRYRCEFDIGASSGQGGVRFFCGEYPISRIYTTPGHYVFYFTAANDDFNVTNNRYPCDITVSNVVVYAMPRYAGLGKEMLMSIQGISGSVAYPLWIGRVVSVTPNGGTLGMRTATLDCVDAMEEFNALEYRPSPTLSATTPATNLSIMFNQLELIWPYAKDYWLLGTSFLGIDTWLFEGAQINTYSAATDLSIDFATSGVSNSEKGIAASGFARDLMALEIGGRFYINARTGKFEMYSHNWDPSVVSTTSLSDDQFDSCEIVYAEDVLNTVSIWYKQKRLGSGNIVLWSSSQSITVPGKSTKTINGRYFDPTNPEINVSAISTQPLIRNLDYVISPAPNNQKVQVTADAGETSVNFTIDNDREIDITVTTLQVRGFPLYALTEESTTIQNADSLVGNNRQKRDYNLPLISDSDTAIAIATGLTTMRGEPITRLQSITFSATKNDTRYQRALALALGSHFTITSVLLKHSQEYVVIGERHSVKAGGENTHMVTWILAPVTLFNYWVLEQAGRSELGITTIPIY